MRLYFARHGESQANRLGVLSSRPGVFPLTDTGRTQAEALALAMSGKVGRVYASPVLRARETAEIVCRRLGLPCEVVDALREYDCGELQGRSDPDAFAADARWLEDWSQGRNRDRGPAGGETFEQVRARFLPWLRDLVQADEGSDEAPLLIGHGGLYRLMLPLALDNIDADYVREHGIANSTVIAAETREGRLVCTQWGEAAPGRA